MLVSLPRLHRITVRQTRNNDEVNLVLYSILATLGVVIISVRFLLGATRLHLDLFLFGVIYYLLVPGIVVELALVESSPGIPQWRSVATGFYTEHATEFLVTVAVWVVAYVFGAFLCRKTSHKGVESGPLGRLPANVALGVVSLPLMATAAIYIAAGRSALFQGYRVDYDTFVRGGIATATLCLYVVFLHLLPKRVSLLWVILITVLAVCGAVLLVSGSRMYVLVPAVGLCAALALRYRQPRVRLGLAAAAVAVAALLAMVGSWRLGDKADNAMLYMILAEPVFTSYSLATFWTGNKLPMFELPVPAISGLLNFVPSILWPDKVSYIVSVADVGYSYYAPLGATSIVVSLIGNFGLAGGTLFLGTLGFILESLYLRAMRRPSGMPLYLVMLSLLPFMFFRDAFPIVLKAVLLLVVVLPFALRVMSLFLWTVVSSSQSKGAA